MTARTDMLAALRRAVPSEATAPPRPVIRRAVSGLADPDLDVIALFRARLVEHGGEFLDVPTVAALPDVVAAFLARHQVHSVLLAAHPELRDPALRRRLHDACDDRVHEIEDDEIRKPWHHRAIAASTTLGIGCAQAGIADSGVIVVQSGAEESRSLSLLTDIHLAVLHARDIVPTLYDCMPRIETLRTERASAAITLIGGPSKTADIEKVLVTGVHGPRTFAVAVIRDASSEH